MKVLIINGSPNKNGNTATALAEAAQQLEARGILTETVHIGKQIVRGCIACGQCKMKGNNRCVFDDDICNKVSAQMAESDGLIVGSPVYYGTPTGPVLSLIHRMLFSAGAYFQNKPVATVAVCRRGGATAAYQTLCMPFQMSNMPIVTSQYWNIAYGREPGQAAQDAEGMQTMRTMADNMAWMLRGLSGQTVPEREEWQPMHFIR